MRNVAILAQAQQNIFSSPPAAPLASLKETSYDIVRLVRTQLCTINFAGLSFMPHNNQTHALRTTQESRRSSYLRRLDFGLVEPATT